MRAVRRAVGGGELGDGDAVLDRLRDMLVGGVVMARQRDAAGARQLHQPRAVGARMQLVRLHALADDDVHLGIGQAALLLVIAAEFLLGEELPLAGRVVHQRDQAHIGRLHQRLRILHHAVRRHLAAQMHMVLGAQQAGLARLLDGGRQQRRVAGHLDGALVRPDAQGIEHGGDAGAGDRRVIGGHRREGVPHHPRARIEMALDMVGMQLDEAGQQVVAAHVQRRARRGALADLGDAPVTHHQMPVPHLVGQHEACIGEHRLGHMSRHGAGAPPPS